MQHVYDNVKKMCARVRNGSMHRRVKCPPPGIRMRYTRSREEWVHRSLPVVFGQRGSARPTLGSGAGRAVRRTPGTSAGPPAAPPPPLRWAGPRAAAVGEGGGGLPGGRGAWRTNNQLVDQSRGGGQFTDS